MLKNFIDLDLIKNYTKHSFFAFQMTCTQKYSVFYNFNILIKNNIY